MKEEVEYLNEQEIDYLLKAIKVFKPGVSLKDALQYIVSAVHDALGFGVCMLSLVERDSNNLPVLRRVSAAGISDEVFSNMASKLTPVNLMEDVMQDRFRISSSYFIPHQEKSVWQDKLLVHTSDLPVPSTDGFWHPEDMLLVPLRVFDGTLIGLLSVDAPINGKIPTLRVIQLLEIFASHATLNIENSRLLENANVELKRRNDELRSTVEFERKLLTQFEALSEIDVALLNSSLDLEDVFSILLEKSRLLTGADTSSILTLTTNRETLRVERSTKAELVGRNIPMLGSICGWVARHNQPRVVKDTTNESLYYKISPEDSDRSEIAVPLRLDSRVIGVLNLQSEHPNAFSEENMKALQSLADRAALALRNAKYVHEIQTIRHIDKAILQNIDDLEKTLKVILTESLKLVDAHHGNLLLLEGNRLIVRATTGKEPIGTELSVDNSVSGIPIASHFAVNIGDVDKEPKYKRVLTDVYMCSELAVPLMDGDQAIGVLNVVV